jgi:hypothetical protein
MMRWIECGEKVRNFSQGVKDMLHGWEEFYRGNQFERILSVYVFC